jgi:hypothetical protein
VIQGTFGLIPGTFSVIQGTFGVIQLMMITSLFGSLDMMMKMMAKCSTTT